MPSKHQFIHDIDGRGIRLVQTPGGDAVGTKQSGQNFYSLVPLSPTSAHGFAMNGRLFCEINEISPHRLHIMVRSSRESTKVRDTKCVSVLSTVDVNKQTSHNFRRTRPSFRTTWIIIIRSRRQFSPSVFTARSTTN